MKHGKRFLWIVPLFCLLAACGGQGTQAESARWDTFHHEGDNVQLSLGMTQAEVEDKLTPAEGFSPSTDTDTVIYGDTPEDRIAVTYYDGVVNNISLDETLQRRPPTGLCREGSPWEAPRKTLTKSMVHAPCPTNRTSILCTTMIPAIPY